MLQHLDAHKESILGVMDLTSGYHQAPLSKNAINSTAFVTFMGVFEWMGPHEPQIHRSSFIAYDGNPSAGQPHVPHIRIDLDDTIVLGRRKMSLSVGQATLIAGKTSKSVVVNLPTQIIL